MLLKQLTTSTFHQLSHSTQLRTLAPRLAPAHPALQQTRMSSVSAIANSDWTAAEGPNNQGGIQLEGKHKEIVEKSLAVS